MESEQQFFMTEKDQEAFFDYVKGLVDSIDQVEETYQFSMTIVF